MHYWSIYIYISNNSLRYKIGLQEDVIHEHKISISKICNENYSIQYCKMNSYKMSNDVTTTWFCVDALFKSVADQRDIQYRLSLRLH